MGFALSETLCTVHSGVFILHQPGPLSLTEPIQSSNPGEMLSLNKALHCMPDQIPADPASKGPADPASKGPSFLLQNDS